MNDRFGVHGAADFGLLAWTVACSMAMPPRGFRFSRVAATGAGIETRGRSCMPREVLAAGWEGIGTIPRRLERPQASSVSVTPAARGTFTLDGTAPPGACAPYSVCVPPSHVGIHLNDLPDFPGSPHLAAGETKKPVSCYLPSVFLFLTIFRIQIAHRYPILRSGNNRQIYERAWYSVGNWCGACRLRSVLVCRMLDRDRRYDTAYPERV